MELFKQNSKIDFMGARSWTALISLILFLSSVASLWVYGLKWGLDFTGGTQIQVRYEQAAPLDFIRDTLNRAGFASADVQIYGNASTALITLAPKEQGQEPQLVNQVMRLLPGATKIQAEFIGPKVGQELAKKGFLAILVSLLATLIYIAIRFEFRFAFSAIVALIHDPVLILGIFSFYQIDFDLKALAAVLAVIGYSLNDTIVVFDRVRENFRKIRKLSSLDIMNLSINQTLSRTIMTSVLTLMVVLALFFYGGETIHGFALALVIGIVIGTYSSIYVAGALALVLGLDRADFIPTPKKALDDLP